MILRKIFIINYFTEIHVKFFFFNFNLMSTMSYKLNYALLLFTAVFINNVLVNAHSSPGLKESTPSLDLLDAMQHMMTGETQFDRSLLKKVTNCMKMFDPRLPAAHEAIWQAMADYWRTRGAPGDRWGSYPDSYYEFNISTSQFEGMTIYEPCNHASAVSYYHSFIEICHRYTFGKQFSMPEKNILALGKTMPLMAVTSAFFHGSYTDLPHEADITHASIIMYVVYQELISFLGSNSFVLNEISEVPRPLSAIEMSEQMINIYTTLPIDQWYKAITAMKTPHFFVSGGCLLFFGVAMLFEPTKAKMITDQFSGIFDNFPDEKEFLYTKFLPEIVDVVSKFKQNFHARDNINPEIIGTMIKIFYASPFHEDAVLRNRIGNNTVINFIGSLLIPSVSKLSNKISEFSYYNQNHQLGREVYPGESYCQKRYSHAKFHMLASLAFLDVIYMGDEAYRFFSMN